MSSLEQENVAKDVTQHVVEVSNENQPNQSTNSPAGISEENGLALQVENRCNRSRQNRRKAVRIAQVRDIFAQRDVKTNDTDSEASVGLQTETAQEQNQAEKYLVLQTPAKGNVELEDTAVSDASKSKTEKCESVTLADVATLTMTGDSPGDSEGLSSAELAPAQRQNINKFVPSAERSQAPARSYKRTDPSGEKGDSKSLVSNSSSYAFGTVVAPLYPQVSSTAGSQSDTGNLVWAASSYTDTESHSSVSTSDRQERDQRNIYQRQEVNHNCPPCSNTDAVEVESSLDVTKCDIVGTLLDANEIENKDQIFSINSQPTQTATICLANVLHFDANSHTSVLKAETQESTLENTSHHQNDPLADDPTKPSDGIDDLNLEHEDKTITISPSHVSESSEEEKTSVPLRQNESLPDQLNHNSDLIDDTKPEHDFNNATVAVFANNASSKEKKKVNAHNELDAQENMPRPAFCFEETTEKGVAKIESCIQSREMMSNKNETNPIIKMEDDSDVTELVTKTEPNKFYIESDMFEDEDITVSENTEKCESQVTMMDIHLTDEAKNWQVIAEEEEESTEDLIFQTEKEEVKSNVVEDDILEDLNSEMTAQEATDKAETVQKQDVINEEKYYEQMLESDMQTICDNYEEKEGDEDRNSVKCMNVNEKETEEYVKSKVYIEKLPGISTEVDTVKEKTVKIRSNRDEEECTVERFHITPHKVEGNLSALMNNVQEDVKDGREDEKRTEEKKEIPIEMGVGEEDFQANDTSEATSAEGGSRVTADDRTSDNDSASSESGSEDEMELYMHCLRAVYGQRSSPKATTPEQSREKEFTGDKRLSINRIKLLSTSLPSISESVDEEQHLSFQENDTETVDVQPTAADPTASSGEEEDVSVNGLWWKETFSCRNILKTLLYTTVVLIFLAAAYHYDFIACFGLYVISVVWLWCQGNRQTGKNNRVS